MNKGKTILGVSISLILSIAITFLTNKNDIFKTFDKHAMVLYILENVIRSYEYIQLVKGEMAFHAIYRP